MKKTAIVIDIDNTLIDTSIRKQSILREMFKYSTENVLINDVRKDYMLNAFLGGGSTASRRAFLEILSSEEGIRNHPAPAFEGALKCIEGWLREGFEIIFLTARPEKLREVTKTELKNANIPFKTENVYMLEEECLETEDMSVATVAFKKAVLTRLLNRYDVLAAIGDRADDFFPARDLNIPFVLIQSTISTADALKLQEERHVGFFVQNSWDGVPPVIEDLYTGSTQLKELRHEFSQQYSLWLGQLDAKCGILIAMAGVMCTIGSALLLKELDGAVDTPLIKTKIFSCTSLGLSSLFALLAIFFGIKGYTSRKTSGKLTAQFILSNIGQALSILRLAPRHWSYKKGDAIDDFYRFQKSSVPNQSRAHYDFFFKKYGCYDSEALANLRLYELCATNYAKAYAESWGSRLAITSLLLLAVWFAVKILIIFWIA
jgi:phosphoglycolate phosphatase-like HAD superfamily hydrolase